MNRNKIVYNFKFKGLSLYCDERICYLNDVICGYLNDQISSKGRKLSRDEFKMLYELHTALTNYLEYYGID